MNHHFDVDDAVKHGVEKAILLSNIKFWLDKELANKDNKQTKIKEYEGNSYVWTFNSAQAFEELFPYMKRRSISRWLSELEKEGVIISSNFNKHSYDRTKWYTMPNYKIGDSIGQNEKGFSQNDPPIPYINTDKKHSIEEIPKPVQEFDFQAKIKMLKESKRDMDTIIGCYWGHKKMILPTKEAYQAGFKRCIRSAKILQGYPDKDLWDTFFYLDKQNFKWTLETVVKYIGEINNLR